MLWDLFECFSFPHSWLPSLVLSSLMYLLTWSIPPYGTNLPLLLPQPPYQSRWLPHPFWAPTPCTWPIPCMNAILFSFRIPHLKLDCCWCHHSTWKPPSPCSVGMPRTGIPFLVKAFLILLSSDTPRWAPYPDLCMDSLLTFRLWLPCARLWHHSCVCHKTHSLDIWNEHA